MHALQPSEASQDAGRSVRGSVRVEDVLLPIAARHRPQKLSHAHYMPLYAKYFGPCRHDIHAVLELGVGDGASLRMWEEWFPEAIVLGVDNRFSDSENLYPDVMAIPDAKRPSTHFLPADQADHAVGQWAQRYAPFDLIIDDASHDPKKQWDSLEMLFPHVKPGGCYVVEGLEYSYSQDKPLRTLDIVSRVTAEIDIMNDACVAKGMGKESRFTPRLRGLDSVHFYPSIIFLWKETKP